MTTKKMEHCTIISGNEEKTSGKHKNGSPDIFFKIHDNKSG